ncbi:MAG: DDE-type integrase/transposase/recombinase [Undibacterium sp.]|nr:DDE-type integrase/transposase/recombinase [Opitutaceae bacterium]
MSPLTSPAAGRVYGGRRVCAAWAFPRATYDATGPAVPAPDVSGKRGPKTPLDDADLLASIRADLAQSPFRGEGHRKVFGRLRYVGTHRVGRNRILRLMRENRLLSPHRTTPTPAKAQDGRITTDAPSVRWATDGATVWTLDDGWPWLFTTIEHRNAECLGHHVCKRGVRFAAYEPVAQALTHVFGTRATGAARGVELRHDHGSQYLADYFQGQSHFHAFKPRFAFGGEPETNGVVERFNRTLKEQIIHGRTYRNRAELAAAVTAFVATYNREWRLEKLRYQTPLEARRAHQASSFLAA